MYDCPSGLFRTTNVHSVHERVRFHVCFIIHRCFFVVVFLILTAIINCLTLTVA